MGSLYDICPKCGAVAKNGKCTSCGRLLVGKTANSTMDKWRSENRQWQKSNREAHQDHCEDNHGDGNVYLNGKVIRKTTNYRSFDMGENFSEEKYSEGDFSSDSYSDSEDDILSYQRSADAQYSSTGKTQETTSNTVTKRVYTTVKPTGRKKKKSSGLRVMFLAFFLIAFYEIISENDIDIDDIGYMIEDFISDHTGNSSDSHSSYTVSIDGNEIVFDVPEPYDGSVYDLIAKDPLNRAWASDEPESALDYYYDENCYQFTDYISEDVDYDVHLGAYYFKNPDGIYNDTENNIEYPSDLEIYLKYPVLKNTGLENEDVINSLIYSKAAECSDAYEFYADYLEGEMMSITSYTYVTYMDNDYISLLFWDYYYTSPDYSENNKTYWGSRISSMTFDMQTGLLVNLAEEISFPDDFAQKFVDTYNAKSISGPLDYMSLDEIKAAFDKEEICIFYTPIGIEVGISREDFDYWATVSFKDLAEINE